MDKFIQQLALGAGKITLKKFRKVKEVRSKAEQKDFVTEADMMAQEYIIRAIKKRYPTHKVISEEQENQPLGSGYTWIIDPLDGTYGFVRGLPFFCSTVALSYKREIILSAAYDSVHDELFFAKKGKGAFLNGKRLKPAPRTNLNEAIGSWLLTKSVIWRKTEKSLAIYKSFFENGIYVLRMTSQGLSACYVAAGRLDFLICDSFPLWDLAPTSLILKEAGMKVTELDGRPWRLEGEKMYNYFAGNPTIHKKYLPILKNIYR